MRAAVAVWIDGSKKAIAHIAWGDIVAMRSGRASSAVAEATCHWVGQRCVALHRLKVKLRADKGLCCSLVEQTSQICSTHVKLFVGPRVTEEDEGPRSRATKILVTIAVAYASDQIAKDELYSMRDKLRAENGIVGGKRLLKKTADASAKSSVTPASHARRQQRTPCALGRLASQIRADGERNGHSAVAKNSRRRLVARMWCRRGVG